MTFVNPQYLVETSWLAKHLDDPDLRVVDCTQYLPGYFERVEIATISGRDNYAAGHIPGAAYVDLLDELTDRTRNGIYAPMPPADQFADVMSQLGVGERTRVVLYDDFLGMFAARIWWMLRAFGFDNAALLNGGWPKWKSEGRPVSTKPSSYPPADFIARPRPELIAQKDQVLAAIDEAGRACSTRWLSRSTPVIPRFHITMAVPDTSRAVSMFPSLASSIWKRTRCCCQPIRFARSIKPPGRSTTSV